MKLNYRNERTANFIASQYRKPLDKPEWFNIQNVSDDTTEILLFDYIGWPFVESRYFVSELSKIDSKNIVIKINSPGGDVWDAVAIYQAIKNHPSKPVTRIESLAASAASFIAMAGHKKQAYKNTMMMIHEPMTGIWGNQYDYMEVSDILKQISENMVDMYADNTNVGKKEIREMLKAETWLNAKTAKEKGFIDTILEAGKPVKAEFNLSIFANLPDGFKVEEPKTEPDIRSIEKLLRDVGGLSKSKTKALLARGWQAIGDGEHETPEPKEEKIDQELFNLCKTTISLLKGENTNGRA